MVNRLANETSPYLLQHKDNPVDWYPWGEEALERARREDKPILLSIGYAACHWCHVMEHESFEDAATADIMNRHYVNVKVDREERPDLDAVYMEAVQTMTGQGGWPMTVFLTPNGRPFYGGTYFPKEDRHGMPHSSACSSQWRKPGVKGAATSSSRVMHSPPGSEPWPTCPRKTKTCPKESSNRPLPTCLRPSTGPMEGLEALPSSRSPW